MSDAFFLHITPISQVIKKANLKSHALLNMDSTIYQIQKYGDKLPIDSKFQLKETKMSEFLK